MKKKFLMLCVCIFTISKMHAQTSNELIGRWKLVKWTVNASEKSIMDSFKTDQVFQIFKDKNEFISINGKRITRGKWKLSSDNKYLNIKVGLGTVVNFKIDYFDAKSEPLPMNQLEHWNISR